MPYIWTNTGLAAVHQGDVSAAFEAFRNSLELGSRAGDRHTVAYAVLGLALTASLAGDDGRAATLHGAASALLEQRRETLEATEAAIAEADQRRLRQTMGADDYESSFAMGRVLPVSEVFRLAVSALEPVPLTTPKHK
jgi:hypothetical protein